MSLNKALDIYDNAIAMGDIDTDTRNNENTDLIV